LLFYSDEDFRHRTLVFYAANKLGDDDPLARVLRTLISEGRLAHEVTIREKHTTALLERERPIAFISTAASRRWTRRSRPGSSRSTPINPTSRPARWWARS
jgi:hypothetical protein